MTQTRSLRVEEKFRYARPAQVHEEVIDGMRNFYFVTAAPHDLPRAQLERGINPIATVGAKGQRRRPAVLIRSSPWKAGTEQTPWHDWFDLDSARGTYFGDHKPGIIGPIGVTTGNGALEETWAQHRSQSRVERLAAAPLVIFRAVPWTHGDGKLRQKGAVEFLGIALIADLDRVDSPDETNGTTFPNLRAQLQFLPLDAESSELNWTWINARRQGLPLSDCVSYAPTAWRSWADKASRP